MKSKRKGSRSDIRISANQMRVEDGGNLFAGLMPLLTKIVIPLAKKSIFPLVSGSES